ncbi:MAG: TetR/AcrR family transcriptional regulator [Verrucomicrobiota bacterium]
MDKTDLATRQKILDAALKQFAHCGYAGASVQAIVDSARVTKPTLYYYFPDKAKLFQALVHQAHDERYSLLQEAVHRAPDVKEQLVEILTVMFDFLRGNRELMRLAFATAFAAPGEVPEKMGVSEKCDRNFEFVHKIIKRGLKEKIFDARFDSRDLAYGFYGQINSYSMAHLIMPDKKLNRATAERIVELFLAGAGAKIKKNAVKKIEVKKT